MRTGLLVTLPAAVAASLLSASVAVAASKPPYDGGLVRITAPHSDAMVKRGPVRFAFRAVPRATTIRAFIDGRRIRSLKHGGRRYRATVSVRGLRPGPHRLLVRSRSARKRDTDVVTFFVVRRRPSLLSVRTVKAARPTEVSVPLSVRLSSTVRRVEVKLNGRDASGGLWPLVGRSRSGRLSAGQGLRFGRNRLTARALRIDGSYDVERRVIRVPRRKPLASAGQNRRTHVGSAIRLSGRRSRATRCGRRLGYSWKLARAPRGSKAKLRRVRSSRPLIKPDRPGRYRVRLTVHERPCGRANAAQTGGPRGSDTMVLDAAPSPPPIGWPIDTLASQDGKTGISYGPSFVANQGPSDSLQILVLDRTDLTDLTDYTPPATNFYDLSSSAGVGQLSTALEGLEDTSMVILAGGASVTASTLAQVNQALALIGVSALPTGTTGPWSAIGVRQAVAGSMFLNPDGALSGYIQEGWSPKGPPIDGTLPPGLRRFTFVYGNYQPFQLTSSDPAATITLGPTSLTLPYESGHGGGAFAAVMVDGQTLQPVGPPQDLTQAVYYVNDPAIGEVEQGRLLRVLSEYQSRPDALLAVQTIGTVTGPFGPGGRGTNPQWSGLSAAMGEYGATQHVFNTISGGYSFVGGRGFSGPAAETSTSQSGLSTAQLNGVLGMSNELSTFEPLLHDPLSTPSATQQAGQGFDYSLLTMAYQPAQPWPGDGDAQYEAAYAWIGTQSTVVQGLNPDLRWAYLNDRGLDNGGGWALQQGYLKEVDCPTDRTDFTQVICQAVIEELGLEVGWVSNVVGFFDEIEQPLSLTTPSGPAQLGAQLADIEQDLEVPATSDVDAEVLDVLSEAFDLASYFTGETLEPVLGSVGALVGASAAMTTSSEGSSVLEDLQYDEAQLALQLQDSYLETALAYGQMEDIFFSDYGKLKELGTAIGNNDQRYTWSNADLDDAVSALEFSADRWGWGKLMPLAWGQWIVPNASPLGEPTGDPQGWRCYDGGSVPSYPFAGTPGDGTGWFKAYVATGSPSTVAPEMWILGSDATSDGDPNFHFPSEKVTDVMNSSFNDNPLLQAQFWAREFDPGPLSHSFMTDCNQ